MTQRESTLIVLIDADDVKSVFSAWPDDICLAACLDREGEYSMVVFHREERPYLPERLIDLLGKEAQEVCFVPRVRGFATRQFLYSDERRLMALVAADPSVMEKATDYEINLQYALEEGLDPAVVLGLPPRTFDGARRYRAADPSRHRSASDTSSAARDDLQATRPGELSPLLPDFLRRSAEQARRPRFSSVRTAKKPMLVAQR